MVHNVDNQQKREYLSHLHEQFAINNNASLSSLLTLFATMIAVMYAYGYVYLHTGILNCQKCFFYCPSRNMYTIPGFLLVSFATLVVLAMMYYLCLYQGVAQRCEQFVIYHLRKDVDLMPDGTLLPKNYTPYNKKGFAILPGLYGEIAKLLIVLAVLVLASTITYLKYQADFICYLKTYLTLSFILISIMIWVTHKRFKKYEKCPNNYNIKRHFGRGK